MTSIPFAPGVFTWPADEPQLIGSQCRHCSATTFPSQTGCPRCGSLEMERKFLPRRGTLWTWTTQGFLPAAPYAGGETKETFKPFGVGLVQLANEVRVEGRLTEADPKRLKIGQAVELTIIPFRREGDTEVVTFAFKPI
jgi:uncharacterized OB-fold protein